MAAVFVAAVIVAFTWLATVRWARFGDDYPETAPAEALSAPLAASEPVSDQIPAARSERRSGRHVPAWAPTEPYNHQEAA